MGVARAGIELLIGHLGKGSCCERCSAVAGGFRPRQGLWQQLPVCRASCNTRSRSAARHSRIHSSMPRLPRPPVPGGAVGIELIPVQDVQGVPIVLRGQHILPAPLLRRGRSRERGTYSTFQLICATSQAIGLPPESPPGTARASLRPTRPNPLATPWISFPQRVSPLPPAWLCLSPLGTAAVANSKLRTHSHL